MHVNRTGAGFHRDSRREARMSRGERERWAIEEDLRDLANLDDDEEVSAITQESGPLVYTVGPDS